MRILALLKRVVPFLFGFVVGAFPVWLLSYSSAEADVPVPVFSQGSGSASCSARSKYSRKRHDPGTLSIVSKPRPGYTDEARQNNVEGTVILRVTFLASGEIGSVVPVKTQPDGLTEQAIEAARRIEFEPARLDGEPVSVVKQVEYTFSIY